MAEILPMGVKLGLDPEAMCRVVTTGTGRSFALEFFIFEVDFINKYTNCRKVKNGITS